MKNPPLQQMWGTLQGAPSLHSTPLSLHGASVTPLCFPVPRHTSPLSGASVNPHPLPPLSQAPSLSPRPLLLSRAGLAQVPRKTGLCAPAGSLPGPREQLQGDLPEQSRWGQEPGGLQSGGRVPGGRGRRQQLAGPDGGRPQAQCAGTEGRTTLANASTALSSRGAPSRTVSLQLSPFASGRFGLPSRPHKGHQTRRRRCGVPESRGSWQHGTHLTQSWGPPWLAGVSEAPEEAVRDEGHVPEPTWSLQLAALAFRNPCLRCRM